VTGGDSARPPPPVPLSVITGFLGAGKTTLLNRLLKAPPEANFDPSRVAVIVNEFGDIGLDHLLVEQVDEGIVLLPTGCLCCTLRGDLIEALERLLRNLDNGRAEFSRVVVETTGLADPAPVLQVLMNHPYLALRFRLDGIVTVVDAVNGAATLDAHAEAVKQVAMADRLVLTKTDLIKTDLVKTDLVKTGLLKSGVATGAPDLAALRTRLAALNPAAAVLDAASGEASAARLLNCGLYDPQGRPPDVSRWLAVEAYGEGGQHHDDRHGHGDRSPGGDARGHHRHDDAIRTFALTADEAMTAGTFATFMDLVRSLHGPGLLRVKGIVKLAEHPDRPVAVHAVQHLMHPPAVLEGWRDGDHRTRMVFICRDVDEHAITALFHAFTGTTTVDAPDRAAVEDNPLVPFGGIDR